MCRTLLARTVLLISVVVALTTGAWLAIFRFGDTEPRAREIAQITTSVVNLVRIALVASDPNKQQQLLKNFSSREGIRLLPLDNADKVETLPDKEFLTLLAGNLRQRLGQDTQVSLNVNGVQGFWVSFHLEDEDDEAYWLVMPRDKATPQFAWRWIEWGLLSLALALLGAWLMVSRIVQPLTRMAKAADSLGRGEQPTPLPEEGPSEVATLATAFNRMAGDIASHERERAEILAGISHDLRTPLARLRLEMEMSVADDYAREGMSADITQMDGIIGQFLDYARGESGEAVELTNLGDLLAEIAHHQAVIGQPVVLHLPDEILPDLLLRPQAMRRALNNLIDNARKYGVSRPESAAEVEETPAAEAAISLHASVQGKQLWLEVQDRGPGIPPEAVEHLKRPFTRESTARSNVTGTGLGLAIVERIARLHGGTLALLPREGGGLIARLVLPW
jgi:two-component system osmolarity sensor histidine kinase EnvZ